MSISQNFSAEGSSLNLNFASSNTLDSRIIFTRTSTATYLDDNGLIKTASANQPRFDNVFNSTTGLLESKGLLIEQSRANLLRQSLSLTAPEWATIIGVPGGFTPSYNVAISPDGTLNASQINSTTLTSGDSIYQDVTSITGNASYTLSVFVKAGTATSITFAGFFTGNSTQGFSFAYNPTTGQVTGGSGTVVRYPNGWNRIYFSITGTNALNTVLRYQIYAGSLGITYLWGAQLEAGRFPTSYIPTTASQVTRNSEDAYIPGSTFSPWFNYTEGTFVVKNSFPLPNNENINYCAFSIGNFNTSPSMEYFITFTNFPRFSYIATGPTVEYTNDPTAGAAITSSYNSACLSYNETGLKSSFNGGVIRSSSKTGGLTISTSNNLWLGRGQYTSTNDRLNGYISQLIYYPKQLSDDQLRVLSK